MIKPLNMYVLVKIIKPKSTIELLPGTNATSDKDLVAVLEAVSPISKSGIRVGHEIIVPQKMTAIIIEQTEDHDLIMIPENIIPGVKNWSTEDEDKLK